MRPNLHQRKLLLIEHLARTSNEKVIDKMEKIIKEDDFWFDLSDAAKASIERGIEDGKNGRKKTHSEVMNKYKKWL